MTVADAAIALRADPATFFQDVRKYGAQGGDQAGQAFGAGFGRISSAAISALLLGTAASLTQLDTAARRYAADVGADAAEMDKAKTVANEFFRTNTQGYAEILGSLAKLRTDQGLTLEQAQAVEQAYLNFAKVAGIDATTAVKGFDDVQDAWNLTAADGVRIMDQLVASNQRYGGSIQQRLSDLLALAPALQALNLKVDDAIALENVFASAGIETSDVLRGLNAAVKNLQPGQTLQDLIDQVASIEDPTKRAQVAMEIFGPRVGAAIALAFGPEKAQFISDYTVSVTDAAGATKAAADTINGSVPEQFRLAFKDILGTLGQFFGPLGALTQVGLGVVALGNSFDVLKVKAIAGWLATLGPVALAAGAGLAFVLAIQAGVDQLTAMTAADRSAAAAAGDLGGAQARLKAQLDAGVITLEEYDSKLDAVRQAQGAQARFAALAAGAENQAAEAAAKAAVANDQGADAAGRAALANQDQAAAAGASAAATDQHTAAVTTAADTGQSWVNILSSGTGALSGLSTAEQANIGVVGNLDARYGALNDTLLATIAYLNNVGLGAGGLGVAIPGGSTANVGSEASGLFGTVPKARASTSAMSDLSRTTRVDLTGAFGEAKRAGDALFDGLLRKQLDAIENQRQQARALADTAREEQHYQLELAKRALFAPVDAEQAALDARRAAEQRASLAASVRDASRALGANTDPAQVASLRDRLREARQALADYDAQAKVNADRAAAQAAADALQAADTDPKTGKSKIDQQAEAAKAAADATAATEKAAAEKKYGDLKRRFDDELVLTQKHLESVKRVHGDTQAAIDRIWTSAGLSAKKHGKAIGEGLANGLLEEVKGVETAALALAKAIAKYIVTHSPAEAGPLHDVEPRQAGRNVSRQFFEGLGEQQGSDGLALARIFAFDGQSPIGGGAVEAGVQASPAVIDVHSTIDLGEWAERTFGGPRFIEHVERGLVRKARS